MQGNSFCGFRPISLSDRGSEAGRYGRGRVPIEGETGIGKVFISFWGGLSFRAVTSREGSLFCAMFAIVCNRRRSGRLRLYRHLLSRSDRPRSTLVNLVYFVPQVIRSGSVTPLGVRSRKSPSRRKPRCFYLAEAEDLTTRRRIAGPIGKPDSRALHSRLNSEEHVETELHFPRIGSHPSSARPSPANHDPIDRSASDRRFERSASSHASLSIHRLPCLWILAPRTKTPPPLSARRSGRRNSERCDS